MFFKPTLHALMQMHWAAFENTVSYCHLTSSKKNSPRYGFYLLSQNSPHSSWIRFSYTPQSTSLWQFKPWPSNNLISFQEFFSPAKEVSIGPSPPAEKKCQCREDDRKVCSSHSAVLSQHLKVFPHGWWCQIL